MGRLPISRARGLSLKERGEHFDMATQDRTQHAQTIGALEKLAEAIEKLDRRLEAIEERVDSIDTNTSSTAWDVGQHRELHNINVTLSNIQYALRAAEWLTLDCQSALKRDP
jgi:uncharacterized protein (UPF0335 family)